MASWLDNSKTLYKENQNLKKKVEELEEKLSNRETDNILVDVLNAFMIEHNLMDKFKHFVNTHSFNDVDNAKDELRKYWNSL